MPAVVRLKRRIDEKEPPLTAFVLNGKKRRLDAAAGDDEVSTVLKFGGTVKEENSTASNIARLTKDVAKELVAQKARKPVNHTERARQEVRHLQQENRFRVVNCMRTIVDDTNGTELTIVDIEKQDKATTSANAGCSIPNSPGTSQLSNANVAANLTAGQQEQTPADSDTGYVYDLYFPENAQQAEDVDLLDDHNLSIRAVYDEIVFEDCYNDRDEEDNDSEDSNQENYFTNDYPDEEEDMDLHGYAGDESEEARRMRKAVERFVLDDSDESDREDDGEDDSSDGDDPDKENMFYGDGYIDGIDTEQDNFVDDIDFCVADRFGMAYAQYKARFLKKQKKSDEDDSD